MLHIGKNANWEAVRNIRILIGNVSCFVLLLTDLIIPVILAVKNLHPLGTRSLIKPGYMEVS